MTVEPTRGEVALVEARARAAEYALQARAENTRAGYDSDMAGFRAWCSKMGVNALPADHDDIAAYIAFLASCGAAVGTIARRLSSIRHYHLAAETADPTGHAHVRYTMAGIRRANEAPPRQAAPLKPPFLFDLLNHCPATITRRDGSTELSLIGLRDRTLLVTGFVGALRRSEIAAADLEDLFQHPSGLLLRIPRSKMHPELGDPEWVVLPRSRVAAHCPVTLLDQWTDTAGITAGPLFRAVTRGNRVRDERRLSGDRINQIVRDAVQRAGVKPSDGPWSAHSLRAGFITFAAERGIADRAIQRQSRHRHISTVGIYTRHESAWVDNAATQLGL